MLQFTTRRTQQRAPERAPMIHTDTGHAIALARACSEAEYAFQRLRGICRLSKYSETQYSIVWHCTGNHVAAFGLGVLRLLSNARGRLDLSKPLRLCAPSSIAASILAPAEQSHQPGTTSGRAGVPAGIWRGHGKPSRTGSVPQVAPKPGTTSSCTQGWQAARSFDPPTQNGRSPRDSRK